MGETTQRETTQTQSQNIEELPKFFEPILWSYNIKSLDLEKNKKTIIVNTLNYGDIKHWRWMKNYYGREKIQKILRQTPETEFRKRVIPLISTIFSIDKFKYARRSNTSKE